MLQGVVNYLTDGMKEEFANIKASMSLIMDQGAGDIFEAIEKNSVSDIRQLQDTFHIDFNRLVSRSDSIEYEQILPISYACAQGSIDVVKHFLEIGIDANIPGTDGKLPIHYACDAEGRAEGRKSACIQVLQALLQANCDVNVVDNMGRTPLFLACEADDVTAVQLLIEHHCNVNIQTVCGDSPMKVACRNAKYWSYWQGREGGVPNSFNSGKKGSAINYPPVQITKLLLQARADPSEATLLPTAVQLGDSQLVQEFLDLGMDINMLDDNMCTPIGIACSSMQVRPELVKLLLDRGADVTKGGGWRKQKPLIFAYVHNSVDKIKLLISYGANVSPHEMSELVSLTVSKSILENPEVIGKYSKELLSWRLLMAHGFTPIVQGTELYTKVHQVSMCSSHDKISPWLFQLLYPIRSLKELCRISIRNSIRIPVDDNIDKLALPTSIKGFLKINDISLCD